MSDVYHYYLIHILYNIINSLFKIVLSFVVLYDITIFFFALHLDKWVWLLCEYNIILYDVNMWLNKCIIYI